MCARLGRQSEASGRWRRKEKKDSLSICLAWPASPLNIVCWAARRLSDLGGRLGRGDERGRQQGTSFSHTLNTPLVRPGNVAGRKEGQARRIHPNLCYTKMVTYLLCTREGRQNTAGSDRGGITSGVGGSCTVSTTYLLSQPSCLSPLGHTGRRTAAGMPVIHICHILHTLHVPFICITYTYCVPLIYKTPLLA